MHRLFGLMPTDEIEIEETYHTSCGTVIIQAGIHGWSIIYGDHSARYEDIDASAQANFNYAHHLLEEEGIL